MDALLDAELAQPLLPGAGAASLDPAMVGKLQAFADRHIAPEARRPAENAMAQVRMRSAFARDRLAVVDRWLETQPR